MDISIVIPAYNEAAKISADIVAADSFLIEKGLFGEIIVVDDGSLDDTAETARQTPVSDKNRLYVASYQPNRGKGYALRTGVSMTTGDILMFADSGLCVPYSDAMAGIELIQGAEFDIAHGSRKLPQSRIIRPWIWYRRFFSWLFRLITMRWMNLPRHLTDTQCGFKIYQGNVARALYAQCLTDGFMFDVEVILRARLKGISIKEFPIQWRADRDSRLSVMRNLRSVVAELHAIKKRFSQ